MNASICASAIQFPIVAGDVDANLQQARIALQRAHDQGARLAVLPEMWSSGYDYKHMAELADETPRVAAELVELSARLDLVIVGSLPERDQDSLYNTAFVHDRGQEIGRYRKLHLFSPMKEDRYLASGDKTLVVKTSVGRLGIAICYDLRFPEMFRKLALDGAELVCLPAQWPSPRQQHWRTLIRARAIENQYFLVAANNCGQLGNLHFFGMSLIVSPRGEFLAEGGEGMAEPSALLDFTDMAAYRKEIPAWHDRRPEIYGILR
ncbi:MAG: carbon-nitrogen hydrolase [Desulfuromonadales bacterium C00003107]|jgi:predicted amidohydrolase|nr:MAG: carbon-nitrogen hydrolase [Desulfuromonadales bacterium C00003107]